MRTAADAIENLLDHIDRLTDDNVRLRDCLRYFANEKTIDERMKPGARDEWSDATPERRIKMMGERKRAGDAAILAARQALTPAASEGTTVPSVKE